MKRKLSLVALVLLAITTAASSLWLRLGSRGLSPAELSSNARAPRPPRQPVDSTLTCARTYKSELLRETGSDWTITASDGGCTFTAAATAALAPLKATATEIRFVRHRPQMSFAVAADGRTSEVSVTRSSGSATLDEKALYQIQNAPYGRHNCGVCRLSTLIDIEYDGPVWIRDTLPKKHNPVR